MSDSINIREYITMFKKRKWIIALILVLCLGLGIALNIKKNRSYVPMYQSYTRIRINTSKNNPEQGFSPAVTSLNQNVSNTYLNLATSKSTLQEVINKLGLQMAPEALKSRISISADESNVEFVNITVTDTNKEMATKIANTLPAAFNNELIKTISLDCVQVIDKAVDSNQALPQPKSKIAIKMVLVGVVISIFIVLLLEFLNNKIITPDDVEKYWDAPLLGVVPYDKQRHPRKKNKKSKLEVN